MKKQCIFLYLRLSAGKSYTLVALTLVPAAPHRWHHNSSATRGSLEAEKIYQQGKVMSEVGSTHSV